MSRLCTGISSIVQSATWPGESSSVVNLSKALLHRGSTYWLDISGSKKISYDFLDRFQLAVRRSGQNSSTQLTPQHPFEIRSFQSFQAPQNLHDYARSLFRHQSVAVAKCVRNRSEFLPAKLWLFSRCSSCSSRDGLLLAVCRLGNFIHDNQYRRRWSQYL